MKLAGGGKGGQAHLIEVVLVAPAPRTGGGGQAPTQGPEERVPSPLVQSGMQARRYASIAQQDRPHCDENTGLLDHFRPNMLRMD